MPDLTQLANALLADRPSDWPTEGREALRLHKLLATAIHRATKLAGSGDKEGESWVAYFVEHFPHDRNDPADAWLLWEDWRTALLKTDSPGPGVGVTHGQAHAHWQRHDGRLILNLEDMWADFERSVEHLIACLREHPDRAEVVLNRWHGSRWTVAEVYANTTASVATTMTSIDWPPRKT